MLVPHLALVLAPLFAQSGPTPPARAESERTTRPAAPYSLPPVSTRSREGVSVSLVPPGAPAAVVQDALGLDDAVPLPIPPVRRETPTGDVVEAPASGDPYFLGFAAGDHHPPAGELVDARVYANALPSYPDGRPTPDTYAFVMFSARMTADRLAQLEANGCRLLGYHPHYTQKVAIPATAIDQVAALPFVRWVGVPQDWQKVHPVLNERRASAPANQPIDVWINVFESDVGAASVRRTLPGGHEIAPGGATVVRDDIVLDHVWVTNGWQHDALEAVGVEVLDFSDRIHAFRARLMPENLALVTALDFVQFVETDGHARVLHDETMPMINADDSRAFYDGGTNSRAIAGIVDSGLENSHADLDHFWGVGWDLSGATTNTGAWNDTCGHGTHVSGTVLGDGDINASQAGVAPGLGWSSTGLVYNIRIFDTCAAQPVDEAAVLAILEKSSSGSPRPHVINNSWSAPFTGSPWVGTETECRLYDDSTYKNGQLHVFSAGNDGPTSGSIGLQPAAKNVLTVGNVLDYDGGAVGGAGNIWTSSSRGPTGDGRWKPNVVAPGEKTTSADASNLTGYTQSNGTSAAAPHVTGIAAALVDYDSTFAYFPERISAQLMATAHAKNGEVIKSPADAHLTDYGAGRVDATRAIWGSGGTGSHWGLSLAAGQSTAVDFNVPAGATRLVAVMHYVERGASAGASQALVNDWDLYLDQPPLGASHNSGEWTLQQSAVDNTELRVLTNPIPGTWRWKLWPTNTTDTAWVAVSIYVQYTDSTPVIAASLTASKPYLKPGQATQMDYSLGTSEGSISGVYLDVAPTGTLVFASTALQDGSITNLLGNEQGGWGIMLGNVDPFFTRNASWRVYWPSEGLQSFCVTTVADNASNSGVTDCVSVVVDSTPPPMPVPISWSHPGAGWYNDPNLVVNWSLVSDPISNGVASGIDGYSYLVSTTAPTAPPQVVSLSSTTSTTTVVLPSGTYYFNLAAADRSGNWSPSGHVYARIDLDDPSAVPGLTSLTHTPNVLSCNTNIAVNWLPATDPHSGVVGYGVSLTANPDDEAPTTPTTASTSTTLFLNAGTRYVHVRAIDGAGNAGPTSHLGPIKVHGPGFGVSTYCTAKTNSQGCVPTMGWTGTQSLSNSTLTVTATNVLNNKSGLLFWGSAASATPFQGGTKCVANPVIRTPVQSSGGNAGPDDCSGTYSYHFTSSYLASKGLQVADQINCQFWSRDPQSPFNTGLTDAVQIRLCE